MKRREFLLRCGIVGCARFIEPAGAIPRHIVRPVQGSRSQCPIIAVARPKLWAADDLSDEDEDRPALPFDPIRGVALQRGRPGSYDQQKANRFRIEVVDFDSSESEQEAEDYCWAAVVQAVLAYNNVDIGQSAIVTAIQGLHTQATGATLGEIVCALNGVLPNIQGRPAVLQATPFTSGAAILSSLASSQPVVVGIKNPGNAGGHVCALTAVEYTYAPRGWGGALGIQPNVHEVDVFDPLPHKGAQTIDGKVFVDSLSFAIVFGVTHL